MVAWLVRILLILILVAGASVPAGRVAAQAPAYDVPGRLSLPWACGEGYVVTWDPPGHWDARKARGLAYDFALPEGTPLYSPGHGYIYYLRDERPLEANLGHYVEIVIEEDWLVRLAHLRDPQSGEGPVRAGEFIGYSGRSGATAAHLHMELFVRDGSRWVAPRREKLERLFGLPIGDLVIGAVVANDSCPAQVALSGPVLPRVPSAQLGAPIDLIVPLRNDGLEAITLDALQVSLTAADGAVAVARAEGEWFLDAKAEIGIAVPVLMPRAGEWAVSRVTCSADKVAFALPGEGALLVQPSDLRLVGVSVPPEVHTGERIVLEAWVENAGDKALRLDAIEVSGAQPDGLPWSAMSHQGRTIPAGEVRRFEVKGLTVPERVGEWRITHVGYRDEATPAGGSALLFAAAEKSFTVVGPELRAESLTTRVEGETLSVLLLLQNVGTETAIMDRIEVWGWKPDGEGAFTIGARIEPIAPGEFALVRLEAPLSEDAGLWRLVEAGYWTDGRYMRVRLPEQPAVAAMDAASAYPAP